MLLFSGYCWYEMIIQKELRDERKKTNIRGVDEDDQWKQKKELHKSSNLRHQGQGRPNLGSTTNKDFHTYKDIILLSPIRYSFINENFAETNKNNCYFN